MNPHPAPVHSCSPGNTLHAPATTGLASQPVASLWTSVLCPYRGHITPGLLLAVTRSLRSALRLALAQGLPVASPPLLPWAALSPSQPSSFSFTQGSGCMVAGWLSQVLSAPSLSSQSSYPLINLCTVNSVLESTFFSVFPILLSIYYFISKSLSCFFFSIFLLIGG